MDYDYFIKDVGLADEAKLQAIRDILVNIPQQLIPRFNAEVKGVVREQVPELDVLVADLQASLDLRDLEGNPFIPYWSINWMQPHEKLREHTDQTNGTSFDDMWTHKVHIPLITTPAAKFGFRRTLNDPLTWLHLKQGRIYMYNNLVFHQVINASDEPRAHLIMYARDQKMMDYFKLTKLWKP